MIMMPTTERIGVNNCDLLTMRNTQVFLDVILKCSILLGQIVTLHSIANGKSTWEYQIEKQDEHTEVGQELLVEKSKRVSFLDTLLSLISNNL